MRDLEIRGAGNLLGAEQSGHIAAVGFDLYMEMVTEAVGELTGEVREVVAEVTIDIPGDANLPREYVGRDDVRMEAYRRLAAVATDAEVSDVENEWIDRYGPLPEPAAALITVARLRVACAARGIRELQLTNGRVRIEGWEMKKSTEIRLLRMAPSTTVNNATAEPTVVVPLKGVKSGGEAQAILDIFNEIAPLEPVEPLVAGDRSPVTSPI